MPDDSQDEPKGKVDWVSLLYMIGGVPALVGFLVGLFALVNLFESIPA